MDIGFHLRELGIEPVTGDKKIVMQEDEVASIEQGLKVKFPEAYRRFLLTYGASGFRHSVKFRSTHPLPEYMSESGDGYIDYFYGPVNELYNMTYSLARMIRVLSERMPESLIPIGGDSGDDQICLGIRGAEIGKIYFWDIENEWDEEEYMSKGLPVPPDLKFQNVHLIAESFEDFLSHLYVCEDDE